MVKPAYQQPIDRATYDATLDFFEKLIRLLHPFLPFITEEIWHVLRERGEKESIMFAKMPEVTSFDPTLADKFAVAEEVIMAIRTIRKEKNIPMKESIQLSIRKNNEEEPDLTFDAV